MTEIATLDWFGRWGTSVFSENTAIFSLYFQLTRMENAVMKPYVGGTKKRFYIKNNGA